MASTVGVLCLMLVTLLSVLITIKSFFPHPDILSSLKSSKSSFDTNLPQPESSIGNYGRQTDLRTRKLNAAERSTSLKSKEEFSERSDKSIHNYVPTFMSSTSPANGTDIITHPISVIKCANQTMCIHPRLQLQPKYDVYFCKHVGFGVRFYFLVTEGLLLHPNIRLIDDIEKAEVIVYLPESSPWHKSECNNPKYKSKTIVLDEGDGPQLFEPDGKHRMLLLLLVRSCVCTSSLTKRYLK